MAALSLYSNYTSLETLLKPLLICCRSNLHYANKVNFWQIANIVLNRDKSVITLLFNGSEKLSSASDKANCLLKTFLGTLILMTLVPLYMLPFYK